MAGSHCTRCGIQPRPGARFCDACGNPIAASDTYAERKQVTVLFADVVRSMDIAAVMDPERLRDVMSALFNRCGTVIQRYGGTVDKFTGDGIMALFGAPIALEDHAVRACVAALELQSLTADLADEVLARDGVVLALRIGLNSGAVVVGDIGSAPLSYTAIGAEVGLAQRMEAVAPAGGILLSEATSRLVEDRTQLADPQSVRVKGFAQPVLTRQLLGVAAHRTVVGRREATLVGRDAELQKLLGCLDGAMRGQGRIVGITGVAGIGKSRLCAELVRAAKEAGAATYCSYCESHASRTPHHAMSGLLRDRLGLNDFSEGDTRASVRERLDEFDAEDRELLEDMLLLREDTLRQPGSREGRGRRVGRVVADVLLSNAGPTVYVVEDVHWIDDASEAMLADLFAALAATPSMVVITYRPEYRGALTRSVDFDSVDLAPLDESSTSAMTAELMGSDPSVCALATQISEQAAGNPFFAQELVRELAEQQVIVGERGGFRCDRDVSEVSVPATLQATIGARIDRLAAPAKAVLNAAAVIGSRFTAELLAEIVESAGDAGPSALAELVHAELIDQVRFVPRPEYAFRHPLIRSVSYSSQLKLVRARMHRRLAAVLERMSGPGENDKAGLIAAHLEAAGDASEAFGWFMRAGSWFTNRDITAARTSWRHARDLADGMCDEEPYREWMRIAPRALLCGSAWRAGGSVADAGFEELRRLCGDPEYRVPLAFGMAGQISQLTVHARVWEAARLADEYVGLLDAIGDPMLMLGLLYPAVHAEHEACAMARTRELAERVVVLSEGDPARGNILTGSPLAFATMMCASADCALGQSNWRRGIDEAIEYSRIDPTTYVTMVMFKYVLGITYGALVADDAAVAATADALEVAQRCSEDFALHSAQLARGIVLVSARHGADRSVALELLDRAREAALADRFMLTAMPLIEMQFASEHARAGRLDEAVELARRVIAEQRRTGALLHLGASTMTLVDCLLDRRGPSDSTAARSALEALESMPAEPGFVLYELAVLRIRAQLARMEGDDEFVACLRRYASRAGALEFDGHIAAAEVLAAQHRK